MTRSGVAAWTAVTAWPLCMNLSGLMVAPVVAAMAGAAANSNDPVMAAQESNCFIMVVSFF